MLPPNYPLEVYPQIIKPLFINKIQLKHSAQVKKDSIQKIKPISKTLFCSIQVFKIYHHLKIMQVTVPKGTAL